MPKQDTEIESAMNFLPAKQTISSLRSAAEKCQGCHLYNHAKQTVFGSGSNHASLMIVGEIPGEKEDELGKPFVGPAGIFLRKAIETSGLELKHVYMTNVVKHFKFVYSYKRKLHRSPVAAEIKACQPWLDAEIKVIKPKAILCLGLTAAKSLVNKNFHIREHHGKWFKFAEMISILVTFHPSAILRAPDDEARQKMKKLFFSDLKKVATFLHE